MTTSSSRDVVREVRIAAPPAVVFAYFTDPEKQMRWMGVEATLDPRPDGVYRVNVNSRNIASGKFVTVQPNERVVFTFGWEGDGAPIGPGASTIDVRLIADGDGTLVRLVHGNLPDAAADAHAEGWDHYLPRLVIAAGGADAGVDPWIAQAMDGGLAGSERARVLAERFVQANQAAIAAVERCTDAAWRQTTSAERWSVGVTAHHIAAGHASITGLALAIATGQPAPPLTFELLHAGNAQHARDHAACTKAETLELLRRAGDAAAASVRAMTDEQLDRSATIPVFGPEPATAIGVIEGVLIGHIEGHLQSILASVQAAV